jgi:hypothetical protein
VARLSVPLVPPPNNPLPETVVTPVIVPAPALAHTHALPFHCKTWLDAHVFVNDKFSGQELA